MNVIRSCRVMSPRPDGSYWVCSLPKGHDGSHSWADKLSESWNDVHTQGQRQPPAAIYGEAVDLACDFARCWTHDGRMDAIEEFAQQLRDELNLALDKHRLARLNGGCKECGALVGHWKPCSNASSELRERWDS